MSSAEVSRVVTAADTAAAWGDAFPPAASTPFVLGLAEMACHAVVASGLADGEVTVGTAATIKHLAPSPVGASLVARATLLEGDGRRFSFRVEVLDGEQVVARVDHNRATVVRAMIDQALAARA